jgi:hypothetical protein
LIFAGAISSGVGGVGGVGRVDVLVGLALLETCFGDGKEEGALVVVLLAVCASWGVFVGKDVAPVSEKKS